MKRILLAILLGWLTSVVCDGAVEWPGELQNIYIWDTPQGFYSGRKEWEGNPQYTGWAWGDWTNTYGRPIFIYAVDTAGFGGEGGNGGRDVCDFSIEVTRRSDGQPIDFFGWDDYGPTAPMKPHSLGKYMVILPGDGIHVRARALNGGANMQTGQGIFLVGAAVSVWATIGAP